MFSQTNYANRLRVIFVGHDATRTGAPILLLQLLKWMHEKTEISFRTILGSGGPLLGEYQNVGETLVLEHPWSRHSAPTVMTRAKWRVSRTRAVAQVRAFRPHLLYSNTIATGAVLDAIDANDVPLLLHVHELEMCMKAVAGPLQASELIERATRIVAASKAVSAFLDEQFVGTRQKTDVVHEYLPTDHKCHRSGCKDAEKLRHDLNIPRHDAVVACCGTFDWRKGADLCVPLALHINRGSARRIHIVWIGSSKGIFADRLGYEARVAGVSPVVHFVESTPEPMRYLELADVFALTSREDPYPLVVLEAAALGKPVVCFSGSGGAPEFVETDCGFSVPFLDVPEMATKLRHLLEDDELRSRMGAAAAQKAKQHDINLAAPKLLRSMEIALGNPRPMSQPMGSAP